MDCYQEHIELVPESNSNCHEIVSDIMFQMGNLCAQMHFLDMSIKHFDKCINGRKRAGNMEEGVAKALYNMAIIQEALPIFWTQLSNEDLTVALALNDVGINYTRSKDFANAIELYSEALRIQKGHLCKQRSPRHFRRSVQFGQHT